MGNFCEIPLYKDKDLIVSNKSQNDSPREKKKIKEIEEIKTEIMEMPLFERKNKAEQKYKHYLNNKKINYTLFKFYKK